MTGAKGISIDQINYLNIIFMVLSLVAAQCMPFEVFLFSYAVLGPAHYLTEISWLHDRKYFCPGKYDYLLLLVSGLALFSLPLFFHEAGNQISESVLIGTFLSGAVLISPLAGIKRGLLIGACFLIALGISSFGPLATLLALYLPTLIHVLLFTGVFVLYGALKGESFSGYLSLLVFIACTALTIPNLGISESVKASEYVLKSIAPFQDDYFELAKTIGISADWSGVNTYMRLMAYAYTYHYLNWFSKTKVIEWHKISPRRLRVIVSIYLTALLIYAIDFTLGLIALLFLSLLHVILEIPLNFRSFWGTGREVARRFRPVD